MMRNTGQRIAPCFCL